MFNILDKMNFASEFKPLDKNNQNKSYNDGILIERRVDNSLPQKTRTNTIYIDSRDRNVNSYPDSNNFSIDLTEDFRDVISAEVVGLEMRKSEYLINEDNKTIYYTNGSGEQTATVAEGNYDETNINGIIDALNDFTSTYNSTTKKFTLTAQNGALSIDFSKGNLADILGFTRKVHTFGGSPLVSDKFADLDGEPYVLLRIEDFDNTSGSNSGHNGCMVRIPLVDVTFNNTVRMRSSDFGIKAHKLFEPVIPRLTKLRIQLTKRDGSPYRNNRSDFVFTIVLTTRFQTGKYDF